MSCVIVLGILQVGYVGAIALGNHPVPVKLPTLLFLRENKASFKKKNRMSA